MKGINTSLGEQVVRSTRSVEYCNTNLAAWIRSPPTHWIWQDPWGFSPVRCTRASSFRELSMRWVYVLRRVVQATSSALSDRGLLETRQGRRPVPSVVRWSNFRSLLFWVLWPLLHTFPGNFLKLLVDPPNRESNGIIERWEPYESFWSHFVCFWNTINSISWKMKSIYSYCK